MIIILALIKFVCLMPGNRVDFIKIAFIVFFIVIIQHLLHLEEDVFFLSPTDSTY